MHPLKPIDPVVIARPAIGVPAKTQFSQAFHGATNRAEPRRIEVLTSGSWMANRQRAFERHAAERFAAAFQPGASVERREYELEVSIPYPRLEFSGDRVIERKRVHFNPVVTVHRLEPTPTPALPLPSKGVLQPMLEAQRLQAAEQRFLRQLHAAPERTPDIKPPSLTRTHKFRYAEPALRREAQATREQVQPPPKTSIVGKLLDLLARLVSR